MQFLFPNFSFLCLTITLYRWQERSYFPEGGNLMSKKGNSIIEAIKYLDAFYKDVGLMFSNFENLLSGKGFISHPKAGNKAAFDPYGVSNHLGMSNKWTLKNIQRMYLKEDEIVSKDKSINKTILSSLVLYPSSEFIMPVLFCGIIKWNGSYSQDEIYDIWSEKEVCKLVNYSSDWRLKDGTNKERNSLVYKFIHLDKKIDIDEFSLFFVDLVKIENAMYLQEIVDTLADMYDGSDDINLDPKLTVDEIPDKLIENWNKPI